jgi:hypothetical protein
MADDFENLTSQTIVIRSLDEQVGLFSQRIQNVNQRLYHKRIWCRDPPNQNITLPFEAELFIYINLAHPGPPIRKYLQTTIANIRGRLIFFLSVRIRFEKYDDSQTETFIWISHKNSYPFDCRLILPDEQLTFVDDLLDSFWGMYAKAKKFHDSSKKKFPFLFFGCWRFREKHTKAYEIFWLPFNFSFLKKKTTTKKIGTTSERI